MVCVFFPCCSHHHFAGWIRGTSVAAEAHFLSCCSSGYREQFSQNLAEDISVLQEMTGLPSSDDWALQARDALRLVCLYVLCGFVCLYVCMFVCFVCLFFVCFDCVFVCARVRVCTCEFSRCVCVFVFQCFLLGKKVIALVLCGYALSLVDFDSFFPVSHDVVFSNLYLFRVLHSWTLHPLRQSPFLRKVRSSCIWDCLFVLQINLVGCAFIPFLQTCSESWVPGARRKTWTCHREVSSSPSPMLCSATSKKSCQPPVDLSLKKCRHFCSNWARYVIPAV